jgi:hypothetical protein
MARSSLGGSLRWVLALAILPSSIEAAKAARVGPKVGLRGQRAQDPKRAGKPRVQASAAARSESAHTKPRRFLNSLQAANPILTTHNTPSRSFTLSQDQWDHSQLPQEIATDNFREPDWNVVARIIWDRTFSPRFLNHFALGFSNFRSTVTNISDCCLEAVPSIPGVFRNNHQPALSFEQYESYGGNSGGVEDHPTSIVTNLTTWVRGNHTFKFGGEYRDLRNWRSPESNESGSFNFS